VLRNLHGPGRPINFYPIWYKVQTSRPQSVPFTREGVQGSIPCASTSKPFVYRDFWSPLISNRQLETERSANCASRSAENPGNMFRLRSCLTGSILPKCVRRTCRIDKGGQSGRILRLTGTTLAEGDQRMPGNALAQAEVCESFLTSPAICARKPKQAIA
jgi:hypothetical protein